MNRIENERLNLAYNCNYMEVATASYIIYTNLFNVTAILMLFFHSTIHDQTFEFILLHMNYFTNSLLSV